MTSINWPPLFPRDLRRLPPACAAAGAAAGADPGLANVLEPGFNLPFCASALAPNKLTAYSDALWPPLLFLLLLVPFLFPPLTRRERLFPPNIPDAEEVLVFVEVVFPLEVGVVVMLPELVVVDMLYISLRKYLRINIFITQK
jgi:hypothetical protein